MKPPVKPKKPLKGDKRPERTKTLEYVIKLRDNIIVLENTIIVLENTDEDPYGGNIQDNAIPFKYLAEAEKIFRQAHKDISPDDIIIEPMSYEYSSYVSYWIIKAEIPNMDYARELTEYHNRFSIYEEKLKAYAEEKRKYDIWKLEQRLNELKNETN